jgi:hypothetical protein
MRPDTQRSEVAEKMSIFAGSYLDTSGGLW